MRRLAGKTCGKVRTGVLLIKDHESERDLQQQRNYFVIDGHLRMTSRSIFCNFAIVCCFTWRSHVVQTFNTRRELRSKRFEGIIRSEFLLCKRTIKFYNVGNIIQIDKFGRMELEAVHEFLRRVLIYFSRV